jgi:hypothetical protein
MSQEFQTYFDLTGGTVRDSSKRRLASSNCTVVLGG